jgi:predicted transcriptional regulator
LRERYRDDPSTHPDFDPDLWMEVGSSSGSHKNQVYELSNTTIENLREAHSVSNIGSSQSVLSTQSKEFVAFQQHTTHLTEKYNQLSAYYVQNTAHLTEKYEQFSANYEQLCQMVMNMASYSGDTCAPSFWPYNNQPPPPPPSPALHLS